LNTLIIEIKAKSKTEITVYIKVERVCPMLKVQILPPLFNHSAQIQVYDTINEKACIWNKGYRWN